jgi:hypothetical protein
MVAYPPSGSLGRADRRIRRDPGRTGYTRDSSRREVMKAKHPSRSEADCRWKGPPIPKPTVGEEQPPGIG